MNSIPNAVDVKKQGFRGSRQPLRNEFGGFKIGDRVRAKIVCVPADHRAVIISLNARNEFTIMLKSKECRDANGKWIVWADEMEKIDCDIEGTYPNSGDV